MFDWLYDLGNTIWAWFGVEENRKTLGALTTALGFIGSVFVAVAAGTAWLWRRFSKKPEQKNTPASVATLDVESFLKIQNSLKADLQDELTKAEQSKRDQLLARIAELEAQIANPEKALTEAQSRIAELEDLLEREGNEIGGDRVAEAVAALEKGDYSIADDLFAEIEARAQPDIERAARAAYGQGEVAEAEIRWHEAAEHYSRAARLTPNFGYFFKAREFAWRSGDWKTAYRFGEDLIEFADAEGSEEQKATALNEHALTLKAQGRYAEAEDLYRQALEIDRATIGEGHPGYATQLNNLAGVVRAQGRYAEAEDLYRQALEIDRATIGEGHPAYAIHLNNLALVVQAQGRYTEAENLYRQALEIDRATIGEGHPAYATHLNNLAGVVQAQGRYAEAEGLYAQGLEIAEKALGPDHPNTVTFRDNLDALLAKKNGNGDP